MHHRTLLPPGSVRTDGEYIASAVTQKMETPVIYFYHDHAIDVHVEVDFPDGIINEWYPDATGQLPQPSDERLPLSGGSMAWDITVDPEIVDLPPVWIDYFYVPAREVDSTPVRHHLKSDERDRFIFYRGLGRFTTPVTVRSAPDRSLNIENTGTEVPIAAFLLRVFENTASVSAL